MNDPSAPDAVERENGDTCGENWGDACGDPWGDA
jgi:hypothetical protein